MSSINATDVSATERRTNRIVHTEGLTATQYAAMALAAVTGAVHLYLYLYWAQGNLPFLLAGVGFFGAVGRCS